MTVLGLARTSLGLCTLAGCSLLYNPNNLPDVKIDAAPPPDAPTDIDSTMPFVMSVGPKVLLEGQGTGGSRAAVLTLVGGNFAPDATIELVATDGSAAPMIELDTANAVRSRSGTAIAFPVTLPIDTARGQKDTPLTIRITQTGLATPQSFAGLVTLRNLPELDAPVTKVAMLAELYSRVQLTAPLTFDAGQDRAVIRAVGAIELTAAHVDASGTSRGAGGVDGPTNAVDGAGPGAGGGSTLGSTGTGAGYGTAGAQGVGLAAKPGGAAYGDDLITQYGAQTTSSSGGGSPGGGGGGTLELTAGGALTVTGAITATGGASNGAGAGSGGTLVLRAGARSTLGGVISALGGTATNNGSNGNGNGGRGRVRYDIADVDPPAFVAVSRRGVAFSTTTGNPAITTVARQPFQLVSAASSTAFNVFILDAAGTTTDSGTVIFGSPTAVFTPKLPLNYGYNQICITPPAGNPTIRESSNCIDISYVP